MAKTVYRSAQPDLDGFEFLRDFLGVKTVIKLNQEHEMPLARECQYFGVGPQRPGLAVIPEPMPEIFREEETEHVCKIIRTIHAKVSEGGVLVKCQHGTDRTGLVVASYQMAFCGQSLHDALETRKLYGVGALRDIFDFFDHPVLNNICRMVQAGEFK